MRKSLYLALAMPAFLLASCSSDEIINDVATDGNVILTAELPGDFTRSFGDGLTATQLTYAVYETGSSTPVLKTGDAAAPAVTFSGRLATLTLNLVKGKTYDIVLWADKPGAPYTFDADTQSITVDYNGILGNDEGRDAFFQTEKGLAVNGPVRKNITLKRPFAQINFGTNDIPQAEAVGTKVGYTELKASNVYSTLNLFSGVASNPVDGGVTFTKNNLPVSETFPVEGYTYLSMNYLLTGNVPSTSAITSADKELTDCEFTVFDETGNKINTLNLSNIPVQRNFRTNIYGSLLTSQVDFNIIIEEMFDGEYNEIVPVKDVATAEELIKALNDPNIETINVKNDLDLTEATPEELTFSTPKTINIAPEATIQLGNKNCFTAEKGLTLSGGGKLTNTSDDNSDIGEGYQKSLVHCLSGELNIDGVTLENDPNYHWHGSAAIGNPYNSSAVSYWGDTNVTITNATINSGEFALCGMGRGVASGNVILTNSTFTSTSSNKHNGKNWAYALRIFGTYAELNDCTVLGVQGGVSTEFCKAVINGGTYTTVNSEGAKDAFYAVYATNGSQVTINGGTFSSPNKLTGLAIDGTSCVVSGDNDTGATIGSIILKGGKFSGKAYNHVTNEIYAPAEGYEWKAIDGPGLLKWEVVKK